MEAVWVGGVCVLWRVCGWDMCELWRVCVGGRSVSCGGCVGGMCVCGLWRV